MVYLFLIRKIKASLKILQSDSASQNGNPSVFGVAESEDGRARYYILALNKIYFQD